MVAQRPLRIATLAHGHPSLSAGGAEVSAYALHRAFAADPHLAALHISCVPKGVKLLPQVDEIGVSTADLHPLSLVRSDPRGHDGLGTALREFRPDVVHFHHVLGFGADAPLALRKLLPDAVIVLTLHEYITICHRQGQMLKTDGQLCHRSDPEACAFCFPDRSAGSFLRRERSLQTLLEAVDAFVAPSAFLADRYVEWGIGADRIAVIENLLAEPAIPMPVIRPRHGDLAFFGQINPFKGVDVLLEAVIMLSDDDWRGRHLHIHGSGLEHQASEYRARFAALLERCGARVTVHGPYDNGEVGRLMSAVEWIVVPSVWWENSPVVIQEAFRAERPVIGSNLGGIAEKVRDGVNGLLFRVGDARDLALALKRSGDSGLMASLRVAPNATTESIKAAHLALYRGRHSARLDVLPIAGYAAAPQPAI